MQVLGVREDRCYETRALNTAKDRAIKYWKKAQAFGPVGIDPHTQGILNREHRSVARLFEVLTTMALSRETSFTRVEGNAHGRVFVKKPGGRCWDQRSMAVAAQMAVNTARMAMKRLKQLGLLAVETSKHGTYVLVKGFARFVNHRRWRAIFERSAGLSSCVSVGDTFNLPPTDFSFTTDLVNGGASQKEGGTSEKKTAPAFAKAFLANGTVDVPDWAR